MIPIHELKQGDYVITDFEGVKRAGAVMRTNPDEKQALVETEVQEFWYEVDQLFGIPLDEALRMGSTYPAQVMKLSDRGKIEEGLKANLTIFSEDYQPKYTVLNGEVIPSLET